MVKMLKQRKFYKHKNYDGIWIMVACNHNDYKMINIENGNRWGGDFDPVLWEEVYVDFKVKKAD